MIPVKSKSTELPAPSMILLLTATKTLGSESDNNGCKANYDNKRVGATHRNSSCIKEQRCSFMGIVPNFGPFKKHKLVFLSVHITIRLTILL